MQLAAVDGLDEGPQPPFQSPSPRSPGSVTPVEARAWSIRPPALTGTSLPAPPLAGPIAFSRRTQSGRRYLSDIGIIPTPRVNHPPPRPGGLSSPAMEHVGDAADAGDGVDSSSVSIVCRRDGALGSVVLAGELDLHGGDAVEAAVAALAAEGASTVSVDAQGVTFVDSSGLGGLLAARAIVLEAGGEFRFGPVTDTVARAIDVAGLSDLLGPAAT